MLTKPSLMTLHGHHTYLLNPIRVNKQHQAPNLKENKQTTNKNHTANDKACLLIGKGEWDVCYNIIALICRMSKQ